jgi:hypothetical protein
MNSTGFDISSGAGDMARYLKQALAIASLRAVASSVAPAREPYSNIPTGTPLQVRIIEKLSSETASVGDRFHLTLAAPVVANGRTLFSQGANVTGEVVNVEASRRFSRPGELQLCLRVHRRQACSGTGLVWDCGSSLVGR